MGEQDNGFKFKAGLMPQISSSRVFLLGTVSLQGLILSLRRT